MQPQPAIDTAARPHPIALASPVALSEFVDMLLADPGEVRTWQINDVWCMDAVAEYDGIHAIVRKLEWSASSSYDLRNLCRPLMENELRSAAIRVPGGIAPYISTNATRAKPATEDSHATASN